jgi:hypothetical protein
MLSSTSVVDRGIPTEEVLSEMRLADPPVNYLVGTPKGRLTKLEKDLIELPWEQVRQGIKVKLLPKNEELYVLAHSHDRVLKERAIRRRKLKRLWARLRSSLGVLPARHLTRETKAVGEWPYRQSGPRQICRHPNVGCSLPNH